MILNSHAHTLVKNYYSRKQKNTSRICYNDGMNDEAKNLAKNLKRLMAFFKITQTELAKKTGISQKTVSNMLNPGDERSPNLANIELVARAFDVKTWHLLLPECPDELLFNHSIEKLVENYIASDQKGRNATLTISEIRADYTGPPQKLLTNGN